MLSFFAGKFLGEGVVRTCTCEKCGDKRDDCFPFSYSSKSPGKANLRGLKWPGNGRSGWPGWPGNEGSGWPGWPGNGGSEFERNFTRPNWPDLKHNFTELPEMFENGTACVCDTDLCNGKRIDESGGNGAQGSSPQNSGSPYFTVICVLAMAALKTLSTINDDEL